VQVTINTDGTHTIKAYATDGNINSTETSIYTIKRDVTDPSTVSLGTPTNVTETGMTVTATASDSTSKVATYTFQASTASNFSSIAKQSLAQTSNAYTFSGLTSGTTYYLRVIVIDNAGRTKTSSTITQVTKPSGKTPSELATKIGDYVDYVPAGSDYTVSNYSGALSDQTFSANDNMKWRIWGVEGNKLLLISETLAGNIQLEGANGYNNAVKILNDACSTAFGNSSTYGSGAITARSINQDDIDKVTNMRTDARRKTVNSNYGTAETPSGYQWPNIYGQEPGKTGGGSLNRSSQTGWITGTTNSSFAGKWTFYGYDITNYATQTIYDALLTNMSASSTSGTDSNSMYWIASRCTVVTSQDADFRMFCLSKGHLGGIWLYSSRGQSSAGPAAVRPVIEVSLDDVEIGCTGSGTDRDPYSMAKK